MLQNIRDRSTGWLAYVIVIGISIPFALWGIDQYFTGTNIDVAKVNETKISLERLDNEYQDRLQEMQTLISENQEEAELQKKIIKRTVLDELIDSVIVREFVRTNKFQISENQLISDIKNNKIFHTNNKFNPKRYEKLLESQGIKTTEYEKIRLSELKTLQFYNNIVASTFLTTQQIQDLKKLKYQTRSFKLLSLSYKDFKNEKKIYTQKEKKDFYIKYKNIFSLPEKYDIEYLVYNKKILREQLSFSNDNLENYYKENQFKYIIPEKRKISQIFLSNIKSSKISNGELIKEILEKLKQGESFESLVVKYSDDKLSNKKQGNIGWISRNELTEEINNAAFNINKVNSISNIVETSQGFYILKLSDIKEAKIPNFNDIENIVKIDYENSQIQNRYETIFEDVSNLLYENPNSLDKVEDYLSVKKVSTNLNTLSKIKKEHKILNNEKVLNALRSDQVYVDNYNSLPLEVKDSIVMLRIKNKSEKEYKKYNSVEKEIESLISTENAILKMKDTITNIENKILNGSNIKEIENLVNKKSTYYSSIERTNNELPATIISNVFNLTREKNVTSIESGTGNFELIVLDKIENGETDLSQKSLKTMFYNEQANSILYSLIQSLREQADIKIYPENL